MYMLIYIKNLNLHVFIKNEPNIFPISFYTLVKQPHHHYDL